MDGNHAVTRGDAATVAGLAQHDHVCWSYSTDEEQAAVLQAYFAGGVLADERLFYFGPEHSVARLLGGLESAGHRPTEMLAAGSLVVGDAEAAYLPDGSFDAEERIEGFRGVAHQAVADGYTGIRVAGENAGVLNLPEVADHWYDYEVRVELLTAAEPILGMCCFDRRECHDDALRLLDAVHRVRLDPDGSSVGPRTSFTVHGRADGRLALSGEVDTFNAAQLRRLLARPAEHLDPMEIDVSRLDFVDLAGIRALESVANGRSASSGVLELQGATPFLRTVWDLVAQRPGARVVLTAG
ncbi:MAG TPA: MEDS domain-containing protein [Mycobacteriales bacterium]|nr:MEDS domain-containing protein [Mycobacteriales bacterium]